MHARVHGWLSDDGPLQALFRAVSRFGCNDLNRLSQEVCASVCVGARLYLSVCLPACLPACLCSCVRAERRFVGLVPGRLPLLACTHIATRPFLSCFIDVHVRARAHTHTHTHTHQVGTRSATDCQAFLKNEIQV